MKIAVLGTALKRPATNGPVSAVLYREKLRWFLRDGKGALPNVKMERRKKALGRQPQSA